MNETTEGRIKELERDLQSEIVTAVGYGCSAGGYDPICRGHILNEDDTTEPNVRVRLSAIYELVSLYQKDKNKRLRRILREATKNRCEYVRIESRKALGQSDLRIWASEHKFKVGLLAASSTGVAGLAYYFLR